MPKVNLRELNPYLKDNGSGYPEDEDENKGSGEQLLSSSLVGDGGASWRLKALKRAQEQAAREGRRFDEVCYYAFQIRSSITNMNFALYSFKWFRLWKSVGVLLVN